MTTTIVFLDRATVPDHIAFKPLNDDFHWQNFDNTREADIISRAQAADIIITNKVPISAATLEQLPKLKHIAVYATGFNIIDIEACQQRSISVSNTPDYSVPSVPEHTLAMILALRRHLFAYRESIQQGDWQQAPFFHAYLQPTLDLKDSRIGIIGSGGLGKATAALAQGIGMEVVFAERKHARGVRDGYVAFDEVIRTSDVISIHCPLTPETANLIGREELQQMKPTALLINTARGGIVNETDLVTAINDQWIAGAGFDVATVEPIKDNNPLLKLVDKPNFLLTPHVAWSSDGSLQTQADMVVDTIAAWAQGDYLYPVV